VIELQNVGETIWRLKEEPGNEKKSMEFVCAFLKKKGFKVQESYMGFTGAFRAEYGEGEQGGAKNPNICFLCQYDATPSRTNDTDGCRKSTQKSTEMSHSMGHNLVTVNALTAALGLQCVIKFATEPMGKVTVIGCASNKEGTGKVAMMDQSCFKGVDFILTAYPSHYTNVSPIFTGSKTYSVQYKGKPDSAKSHPWEITNPVNAVIMAYQNVSAARGKFLPDWKATSVITSAGESADRIPRQACMEWLVQAPKPEEMKQLDTKLQQCLQAAATASGCDVEVSPTKPELLCNVSCHRLSDLYIANGKLNGFTFHNFKDDVEGPDDIANVSTTIPVLKVIYYSGDSARPGTDDFTRYVGSKECQFMSVVQGKTLAMVAVDLMTSENDMKIVFEQHQTDLVNLYGGAVIKGDMD